MTKTKKFLEDIYGDLERLLPSIQWKKQYYISFYNNITRTYYVKIM